MKRLITFFASFAILALTLMSCGEKTDATATRLNCEKHDIAKVDCGFCDKTLIESKGFCKEHDVAEVLCVTCSPAIIPAYKKDGDWCTEHATPESLCKLCGAE